jgi:hypothetical protein
MLVPFTNLVQGGKGSKKKAEEAARKAEEERLAAQLEEERLERERLEREEEEKACLSTACPENRARASLGTCVCMQAVVVSPDAACLWLQRLAEEKRQWLEIENKRMEEEKDELIPLLGKRSKQLLGEEAKQQEK